MHPHPPFIFSKRTYITLTSLSNNLCSFIVSNIDICSAIHTLWPSWDHYGLPRLGADCRQQIFLNFKYQTQQQLIMTNWTILFVQADLAYWMTYRVKINSLRKLGSSQTVELQCTGFVVYEQLVRPCLLVLQMLNGNTSSHSHIRFPVPGNGSLFAAMDLLSA